MDHHSLPIGAQLFEYRIDKLLGEGGFGLTYLAFDTHLDKKVAIKEYMPDTLAVRVEGSTVAPKSGSVQQDYQWGLKSFLKEAKALAMFEDLNIVRIFRYFEANGTAYIAMEYCEGGCLTDRIGKDKRLSEAELQAILSPIMNSLQLVHDAGVYHRDIKPDNIMFRGDGTPVLIDFGAARQATASKTQTASSMCTPPYAAWEQYQTKGGIGPWSDIYGLSVVAYECLTGERPPESVSRIPEDDYAPLGNSSSASAFLKAIDWGLQVFAKQRPQSLSDWYAAWGEKKVEQRKKEKPNADASITSDNIATANSTQIPNTSSSRKRRLPISIVLLLAALVLIGGAYYSYDWYQQEPIALLSCAEAREAQGLKVAFLRMDKLATDGYYQNNLDLLASKLTVLMEMRAIFEGRLSSFKTVISKDVNLQNAFKGVELAYQSYIENVELMFANKKAGMEHGNKALDLLGGIEDSADDASTLIIDFSDLNEVQDNRQLTSAANIATSLESSLQALLTVNYEYVKTNTLIRADTIGNEVTLVLNWIKEKVNEIQTEAGSRDESGTLNEIYELIEGVTFSTNDLLQTQIQLINNQEQANRAYHALNDNFQTALLDLDELLELAN